ncbi:hypothetical protein [Gimesia chilikensis]|uniref:hypothetical protein n=1 Tax=Gimesia chilikensis TaxID=2605989 RepID=UPI003A8CE8D3
MKGLLYIGLASAAAVVAIGVYLIKKNKNEDLNIKLLDKEVVDEIEFDKIIDFFKERAHILGPNIKPIGLRLNDSTDLKKYNLSFLKGEVGFVLTFYNENSESIDMSNSKVLISNKLDKQTQDAFGDKEMIIFS